MDTYAQTGAAGTITYLYAEAVDQYGNITDTKYFVWQPGTGYQQFHWNPGTLNMYSLGTYSLEANLPSGAKIYSILAID
jgi:hypothetical protein